MRAVLLFLLFLPLLPGCAAPSPGCAALAVPPLRGGSRFTYAAEGTLETFATQFATFDPKAVGGTGDDQLLVMAKGDHVVVAVGGTASRFAMDGSRVEALQLTYWYNGSRSPVPVAVMDEWVEPQTGRLVAMAYRNQQALPDGVKHNVRLSRFDWAPAMLAALAWGHPLVPGTTTFQPAPEQGGPAETQRANLAPFEVTVKAADPPGCQMQVAASAVFLNPSYANRHYAATFGARSALPLALVATGDDPGDASATTRWTLESSTPGNGTAVLAFQPREALPGTTWALKTPGNGFLAGAAPALPTSFDEAAAAARQNATVAAWLRQHPDARPAHVRHALGAGDVVDEWLIAWAAPGGEGFQALVDRRPDGGFGTAGKPRAGVAYPDVGPRMRLDDLAALSQALYGGLETLECSFAAGNCNVGTHAATGMPRAGGSGAYLAGALVDVRHGWLLQETGYSDAALGPPVPLA
ncbi:MAG: hypothetical protein QOI63_63 [Thermoplasmata archaeon]|nr:hypothetical protein [Thermoplasmata archaeon]